MATDNNPIFTEYKQDGQSRLFADPQHFTGINNDGRARTGERNPLPVGNYMQNGSGIWVPVGKDNPMPIKQTESIDVNGTDKIMANQNKIINVLQSDKLIFGVHWDKTSSPELTRIDDSEGLAADVGVDGELVKNDFDRMPIYSEIAEVEDDYSNRFMRIPKFYIQKSNGKNHLIIRISKTRYPGFYLPYVFWDFKNSQELDYFDFGKYNASLSGDKLESKPSKHPLTKKSIVNFRTYAKNNNDSEVTGYQQLDVHAVDVVQTLFTVEFATLNSQSVMYGFTKGPYAEAHTVTVDEKDTNNAIVSNSTADSFVVGQAIGIGTSRGGQQIAENRILLSIENHDSSNKSLVFDGDAVDLDKGNYIYSNGWKSGFSANIASSSGSIENNTNGKYPCSYRGIENPWGSVYQWIDGININDHQSWIAKDARDYASNVFASPYEDLNYKNAESNGYAEEMGSDSRFPFAQLPIKTSGGSTTYYSDNYYQNAGQRVARFGGNWANGASAGVWFWRLHSSSGSTSVDSGGRLLKKPL